MIYGLRPLPPAPWKLPGLGMVGMLLGMVGLLLVLVGMLLAMVRMLVEMVRIIVRGRSYASRSIVGWGVVRMVKKP